MSKKTLYSFIEEEWTEYFHKHTIRHQEKQSFFYSLISVMILEDHKKELEFERFCYGIKDTPMVRSLTIPFKGVFCFS